MPYEAFKLPVQDRVNALNDAYKHHAAIPVLSYAINDPEVGRVALVSSFGAESVVLLHMISLIDCDLPILFIDTQMLFPETLAYQQELSAQLGLTNVEVIRADQMKVKQADPFGRLHLARPDQCCALRKVTPLQDALAPYDAWITGRKRFQAGSRAALATFENENDQRIKINPLAKWRREDVQDYIINNRLPRHPLVDQGYPSIGCAPSVCTRQVKPGEDDRAGRWSGKDKIECGIHFTPTETSK